MKWILKYWTWPFYLEYCDEKILNMMIDVKIWWDEVDIEHGHFILNIVMKRFWIWWLMWRFDEMKWILNMAILFWILWWKDFEYDDWCEDLMRWSGYWTWPFYFEYCDEKILNMMMDVKIWWDEVDIEHGYFIFEYCDGICWIWFLMCWFGDMKLIWSRVEKFLEDGLGYCGYDVFILWQDLWIKWF